MLVLADTNVLLRAVKPDHHDFQLAADAISILRRNDHVLAMVPQCGYEYYVVATRPADQNGLGMSPDEAIQDLDKLITLFRLLRDERSVFTSWRKLVEAAQVRGKAAHDARIVAAMLKHGIEHLLTFNAAHFARYDQITVLEPQSVASGSLPL